ncbi:maltose permease, partial [Magnaporthiopsis poae ATCC 64411]
MNKRQLPQACEALLIAPSLPMSSCRAAMDEKNTAGRPAVAQQIEDATPSADAPNKDKVQWRDFWDNRRVLMFCFIIYLLPVNFGYEISMLGQLLAVTPFAQRFGYRVGDAWVVGASDQGILNAANTVGIFASAFATGVISDYLGRKRTIIVACAVCAAGVIIQYFGGSIAMLFGGKLVSTVGYGVGHSLGPVFVAEMAPVKMRGLCLVLVNTMIVLGQWLSSLVVYACSEAYHGDEAWRIPIITQIIPPGILMLALVWLPESPSWLLIKGRREDARKAFLLFNGPGFDADAAVA